MPDCCSTTGELLAWQHALATGRVVSPGSWARMTTPDTLTSNKVPADYGFGLQLGTMEKRRRVYHNGGIHGFVSELHSWPDDSLVVVVLTNTAPSNPGRLARNIARAVIGFGSYEAGGPLRPRETVPLAPAQRATYLGEYDLKLPNGTTLPLRIFEEEGALMRQARGQRSLLLFHQGEHTFLAEAAGIRIVFTVENGKATRLTLHQGGATVEGARTK